MLNKKSILFCIQSLHGGGAEKLLIDILSKIDYNKYLVDLCVIYGEGIYLNDIPENVNCFFYEENFWDREGYDVEIAFLEGLSTKLIALRDNNAYKIAWIHTDIELNHWSSRYYTNDSEEEMCYNMMDRLIFVSNASKTQFEKLFPKITIEKEVIYNLFDKQSIIYKSKLFSVNKSKITLCCIGRLVPLKGYDNLILIANDLRNEGLDFHLWILGDGHQRKALQEIIDNYSLNEVVFLKGFKNNPYPWLKAADIFVSVSSIEGFPLVIGEALCLGKPIFSTKIPGASEMLNDGEYGYLADFDRDSIYSGLKTIITNISLREKYERKAKEKSMTDLFDTNKSINQIYKLFDCIAKKTPIEQIVRNLASKFWIKDLGLFHGKMGIAIFFFYYSRYTKNTIYEDYGMTLIEEIQSLLCFDTPTDYEHGLAGIGVGIEYLSQNRFIYNNLDFAIKDFDNIIHEITMNHSLLDFSLLNGYIGYGRYWMFRFQGRKNKNDKRGVFIQKMLKHILTIINNKFPSIKSKKEQIDVAKYLLDMKQFSPFSNYIDEIINNYSSLKILVTKSTENHPLSKSVVYNAVNQINTNVDLHENIYRGLYMLTLNSKDVLWVNLL